MRVDHLGDELLQAIQHVITAIQHVTPPNFKGQDISKPGPGTLFFKRGAPSDFALVMLKSLALGSFETRRTPSHTAHT